MKTQLTTHKDSDWKSHGDWLGTVTTASRNRHFKPFAQARNLVRSLGLKSGKEWKEYTKSGELPKDIPSRADVTCKDLGWKSHGDWLGTGAIANQVRTFKPFKEARAFVGSLG